MNILEETSVLYKRDSNGRVRIWKGEVNSQFQWRTITGLQEGKQVNQVGRLLLKRTSVK